MSKRLTPTQADLKPEYADDHLTLCCMNIENSLLEMGAEPGKDYTYRDLMGWAVDLSRNTSEELKFEWSKS